jgi:Tfp pilus assembly protein PilW
MSGRRSFTKPEVRNELGTTMTELMMAMGAGLIVLGATLQVVTYFQRHYSEQQESVARHQDLRLALDLLEQELRTGGLGSISIAGPDELQFQGNIHGLVTTVTATATVSQTTLSVEDGRSWGAGKTVLLCVVDPCETHILARDGQRFLLTITDPLARAVPVGSSVSMINLVRYYTRRNEQGFRQLMRMVDGGASVLSDDIQTVQFSYWDERGQTTASLQQITRVVVDVGVRHESIRFVRDISVRT